MPYGHIPTYGHMAKIWPYGHIAIWPYGYESSQYGCLWKDNWKCGNLAEGLHWLRHSVGSGSQSSLIACFPLYILGFPLYGRNLGAFVTEAIWSPNSFSCDLVWCAHGYVLNIGQYNEKSVFGGHPNLHAVIIYFSERNPGLWRVILYCYWPS